jgi:hypothetical protein
VSDRERESDSKERHGEREERERERETETDREIGEWQTAVRFDSGEKCTDIRV